MNINIFRGPTLDGGTEKTKQTDLAAQGPGKPRLFGVAILRCEPTATTWLLSIRHLYYMRGTGWTSRPTNFTSQHVLGAHVLTAFLCSEARKRTGPGKSPAKSTVGASRPVRTDTKRPVRFGD